MTKKDKNHLLASWKHETGDPETQEWREDLTDEARSFVDSLDDRYISGIAAMCSAVLVRERVRARFSPEEIKELETVYDHCVLRTRSGRQYIARLDKDGQIVLEEVT